MTRSVLVPQLDELRRSLVTMVDLYSLGHRDWSFAKQRHLQPLAVLEKGVGGLNWPTAARALLKSAKNLDVGHLKDLSHTLNIWNRSLDVSSPELNRTQMPQ